MTAQVEEKLIMDGEELAMSFCPPLPLEDPRLIRPDEDEMEEDEDGMVFSTACWREYIGTWEIKDGKFYLVGVVGRFRLTGGEPLLADWFTGVLRVTRGEILHYIHMGYGSVFEEELHITIRKGIVKGTKVIDNRNKKTDETRLTWENLPGFENRFEGDTDPGNEPEDETEK